MGVLVDKSATFEVSFHYRLIKNEEGETVGVAFADDEGWGGGEYIEFKSLWVPATHEEMTFIREESSVINHINEKAILLLKEFRPRLICSFCREWNLTDDEGYPLPITREVIANMFELFVINIIEGWKKATGVPEKIPQDNSWENITKDIFKEFLKLMTEHFQQER